VLGLLLAKIAMQILSARIGGKGEDIAKIPGLIIEAVVALNNLAIEETGKPIDWSSLQEHHHFSAPEEPPSEQ